MLRAAIEGIKTRGQSDVGDKTLLDALVPLTDRLEQELTAGSRRGQGPRRGRRPTREAAEATSALIAKRGRASYTGERSIGSVDAGAMAVAVITEKVSEAWNQEDGVVKKFVNDPKQFVPEMLEGIALANPDTLTYVPEYNLIMRKDAPRDDKVSIVQGSGSGHEPRARHDRRQGHARRRLSRRRVRRAADGLRLRDGQEARARPRACCCW